MIDGDIGPVLAFGAIAVALALYAAPRVSMELASLAVVCLLLLAFHIFPETGTDGRNKLGPADLLAGFANPALIALLGLIIIGQGLAQTGALDRGARALLGAAGGRSEVALTLSLLAVLLISGVLNNVPVVVIFIPILQTFASRGGAAPSRSLMILSFASILGGMTTLIGSSTNLLVSGILTDLGQSGFGFFDFTVPGLAVALPGLLFAMLVVRRLLPDRSAGDDAALATGRQFLAQIDVVRDRPLDGLRPAGGFFPQLADVTVHAIQRGEASLLPPFEEDAALVPGDILIVSATRASLTDAVRGQMDLLHPSLGDAWAAREDETHGKPPWLRGRQLLGEVMVTPGSELIGRTLEQIGFRYRYNCVVVGVQRRAARIRRPITDLPLAAGDVLLVQGTAEAKAALRGRPGILPIEWSASEVPSAPEAWRALAIFAAVVGLAALDILPIEIGALAGAAAMLATGVMTLRQAARAIGADLVLVIAAALALGKALQVTGGAEILSDLLAGALAGAPVPVVLSAFFLLVAVLANLVGTKAVAVLFTPIAVSLAQGLGAPIEPFAVAVVFGANCAFATPMGYQTNLLVMGPAGYRFQDFVRAGLPMLIFVWATVSVVLPLYYGL